MDRTMSNVQNSYTYTKITGHSFFRNIFQTNCMAYDNSDFTGTQCRKLRVVIVFPFCIIIILHYFSTGLKALYSRVPKLKSRIGNRLF
jgi:hypothetical protein